MIGRRTTRPTSSAATTYLLVAAAILAVVVTAHLLPARAGDSYLQSALFDVAHVLGFAAVTALAGTVAARAAAARGRETRLTLALVTGAVLALAVLSESLQYFSSRDASLGDLVRDACGIAAGLAVVFAARALPRRRVLLLGLAALCLAVALEGPAGTVAAVAAARLDAAEAASFDGRYQRRLLVPRDAILSIVPAPDVWPRRGRILRVTSKRGTAVTGFTYHGLPSDWSGFETLSFTIASEDAALTEVMLRVEGPRVDRYRRRRSRIRIPVATSPREVSIAMTEIAAVSSPEAFDDAHVYGVSILSMDAAGRSFLIDGFRLE